MDVLFAVNALSGGYIDSNEDRRAYAEVLQDYFAESGDETEAETENEDGMSSLPRILIMFSYPKRMDLVALIAQREGVIAWMG